MDKEIRVTTFTNHQTEEFFFSVSHLQGVGGYPWEPEGSGLGEHWVPCTTYLPMYVVPRPGLEDGIIRTIKDYVRIFHSGEVQIDNPDLNYDPIGR